MAACNTPSHNPLQDLSNPALMSEVEEAFLHAVDFGDVSLVKTLLERYPSLNVDCTDALGRTPLRLAVKNENKELVEIFLSLSNPDNMHQAVLQAIDSGFTNIAEVTLRHPRYMETFKRMRRMGDTDGFFKPERGSQFPSYVTPLNLAAQKNQYLIVQLLLQRGETITKPHKFGCSCQECMNKIKFDLLRSAKCRLDAYKGLASEAYISLYSKDPFLTAFELAHELRNLADCEVFFKKEYTDLANHLCDYVVKLLDRVWTQRELSTVLDKTGLPQEDRYESLARLKLAIDYKEKLFVSHPNCQQRLDQCWYEGLGKIDTAGWSKRSTFVFLSTIAYPFLVFCFLFAPNSKPGRSLAVPAVKFISHTLSFFIFLALIISSAIETMSLLSNENTLGRHFPQAFERYTMFRNMTGRKLYGSDFPLRAHELSVTQILITIWVTAMIIQECQEIWSSGWKNHFHDLFNFMDVLLLSVYMATYSLRVFAMLKWREGLKVLSSNVDLLKNPDETEKHVYWLNADRIFWKPTDPLNMAEGLFAMANILSFTRIAYLLPANESLGPLQISLGRMMVDIIKFFALVIVVIGAFMVGLRNLFWYYAQRHNIELDSDKVPEPDAVKYYGSELATFRTVFWEVYGRGDVKSVSLGQYNNTVTSVIGEAIDGLYHITMILVLLNIIIAMMTRSFEKIQEDSDVEWKFARSALYMDYITEGRVLPVPLNVIEILYEIILMCIQPLRQKKHEEDDIVPDFNGARRDACSNIGSRRHLKGKKVPQLNGSSEPTPSGSQRMKAEGPNICRARPKSAKGCTLYQETIQSIIQRYIYDIHRENEISGGGAHDVKNHFERMRYEVQSQYKVKDESISMVMGAVHDVAKEMSTITGKSLEEMGIPPAPENGWGKSGSMDSQDSVLFTGQTPLELDKSYTDYLERYKDILCDVHEEPESLPNDFGLPYVEDDLSDIDEVFEQGVLANAGINRAEEIELGFQGKDLEEGEIIEDSDIVVDRMGNSGNSSGIMRF